MAEFIHSILAPNQLISADGSVTYDLPVNPLSAILLHVSPLNETSTITTYRLLEGLLSAVDKIRVLRRGVALFDANGVDTAMVAMLWHRMQVWQSNAVELDNVRRSIVLPVLFGRHAYMRNECMPVSKKGELILDVTWDIADSGFDGLRISIETIELLGATPEFVQKVTTLVQTFAATGQNDVDLPIGAVVRAVLLFGTTAFSGASPAPTWGQVSVLRDNKQLGYTSTDWEVLRGTHGMRGALFPPDMRHTHSVNAAAVARDTSLEPEIGASLDDNYALLSFDPLGDDEFVLNTAGAGRVNVRADAETADLVRVLPIERFSVGDLPE